MNNHEFMAAAEKKVAQCWAKLMQKYDKVLPSPNIRFDLRSRRNAGIAIGGHTIRLNLAYVKNDAQEMIEQVIPHEVAHSWLAKIGDPSHARSASQYVDQWSVGRRTRRSPHGYEFMSVLSFLGGRPERTHKMKVDTALLGRRGVTWKYKCDKCGYEYQLSTQLHNKISRGDHRYHPRCGTDSKIVRAY